MKKEQQNPQWQATLTEMEQAILNNLSNVSEGCGRYKWAIAEKTGIPNDILTVLLKRLKYAGKVEIIPIWNEYTGLPAGSGYCLKGWLRK